MGVRLTVRGAPGRDGELVFEFGAQRIAVGRGSGADVRLPDPSVSGRHAILRPDGAGFVIEDEVSTNGTWVNGARIAAQRPKALKSGDTIRVGRFELEFRTTATGGEGTSAERTAAIARQILRGLRAQVGRDVEPARVRVLNGPKAGETAEIGAPPFRLVIGRGDEATLVLADADASRAHCEIVRDLDGTLVRDLGSKNGIRVNDRPIGERRLKDRDEVLVGATLLLYEDPAEAALASMDAEADATAEAAPPASVSRPPDPIAASLVTGPTAPVPAPAVDTAPPTTPPEAGAVAAPPASGLAGNDAREKGEPTGRSSTSPSAARAAAAPADPPPAARAGIGTDAVIYVLAAVVLAISIAGLIVLLSG